PSKFTMTIKKGDVFRHVLAGAGGWGDPLERDPAAVLRDVRNELLSAARALTDYGVVVVEKEIDTKATAKRRAEMRAARGWRDVLEIRTLRMPRMYDLTWTKPAPLVERYLRQVVDERVNAAGVVERALDPRDAERAVDALLAERIESIAVCLLHSFTYPAHEVLLKDIIRRKA